MCFIAGCGGEHLLCWATKVAHDFTRSLGTISQALRIGAAYTLPSILGCPLLGLNQQLAGKKLGERYFFDYNFQNFLPPRAHVSWEILGAAVTHGIISNLGTRVITPTLPPLPLPTVYCNFQLPFQLSAHLAKHWINTHAHMHPSNLLLLPLQRQAWNILHHATFALPVYTDYPAAVWQQWFLKALMWKTCHLLCFSSLMMTHIPNCSIALAASLAYPAKSSQATTTGKANGTARYIRMLLTKHSSLTISSLQSTLPIFTLLFLFLSVQLSYWTPRNKKWGKCLFFQFKKCLLNWRLTRDFAVIYNVCSLSEPVDTQTRVHILVLNLCAPWGWRGSQLLSVYFRICGENLFL